MGSITETATSAPGNSSLRPNTKAPLALTLKLNGYSTAQFGKCHEVPVWQTSPMGPFDAWPSVGGGFEHFYGFIGGETNQYAPALYDGTTPVEPDRTPEEGYHLTEDLADHAISWVRQQKALMPDKPFFVYFAPGATHAPHHVPSEWIDKYAGRFDDGWDAQRERTFARQKELGVIPADAELTERHAEIPAWDEMPDQLKPVLARQMEVYAGFLEHTDYHVGRLIDAVEDLGVLDDTVVYYIVGDNGASAEGTLNGAFNEMANFNGMAALETPEFMVSVMDDFGSPRSYNHYSVGWAWAMDTPFQWTKQVASHWGGTRNGTIVHWPSRITERGGHRSQFTHVIDVAPTILEAAGLPEPTMVNGVQQSPMEGTSMLYSFNDADAAERHDLQYFEMFANRGIYHRGWSAVTKHRTPWVMVGGALPAFDDDVWELYDGSTDYSPGTRRCGRPPRAAGQAAATVAHRGHEVQRPTDGRPDVRTPGAHDGGTTDAHPRHIPDLLPRDGAPLGELRRQHQEHVVQRDGGRRRAGVGGGGRAHRPGWSVRRLGALREGRDGQVRLQRPRHPRVLHGCRPTGAERSCPDPDGVRV
jgi:arylsulfatase